MLVKRDKLAERSGRQTFEQQGVGWAVSLECPVRREPRRRPFLGHLFGRLAERQRFALGKDVGEQQVVMFPQRIEGASETDEVARNQSRALMDELIERVLAVGARLAPVDWPRVGANRAAVERDVLAVALHRELLQISGEALEILLVGQHGDRPSAEEVVVPKPNQTHQHRQVFPEWRGAEVLVHSVKAAKHLAEMRRADMKHPKRPRDPAQLAKLIVDMATGNVPEDPTPEGSPAMEFRTPWRLEGRQSPRRDFNAGAPPGDCKIGRRETLGTLKKIVREPTPRFRFFDWLNQPALPFWIRHSEFPFKGMAPPNPGCVVTVGIAAIIEGPGLIVTVSDKMLSSSVDLVQATDNATLKTRKISDDWGIMFSGNGELFIPFVAQSSREMGGVKHDFFDLKTILQSVYKTTRECSFFDANISRLGYKSLEEFRSRGLRELGRAMFSDIMGDMNRYDLGIDFIVYGYDTQRSAHICSLENPGVLKDCGLGGYIAVGSGQYMATAALSRKPLPNIPSAVIYRVLGAKFAAETAAGVGKSTTVLISNPAGRVVQLSNSVIQNLRNIWERELSTPDPEDALQEIEDCGSLQRLMDPNQVLPPIF